MIQGHSEAFRMVEGSLAVVGLIGLVCCLVYGISYGLSMRAQRKAVEARLRTAPRPPGKRR